MRARGRKPALASRLHRYGLQESEGVSLPATSDAHVGAKLRVCKHDLLRLQCRQAGRACAEGPIVALFSTGDRSEPVSLASAETMRVLLPPQAGPRGAPVEWDKLVVVAHAQYTGGMHVSGIIHRALVWLEWE